MSTRHVSGALAVATGLALTLWLCSCAFTSDLSGSIAGRVMIAGSSTPIPGALVECEGIISASGSDGYYSIGGIRPGDRVVSATASGYEAYSSDVNVGESTDLDIYMAVGAARVFGHVRHATLGPLEGAIVQIGTRIVVTDSLGFYECANLQQINYLMTVAKPGYRSSSRNVRPTSEDYQVDVSVKKLATETLWSAADAGVYENSPDANYGDDTGLSLFNNEYFHERFYIRFPIVGIEDTAEPSVAALRMYNTWDESGEDPITILVASLIESWDELEVTWLDSLQTTGGANAQATHEDAWYEVDVGSYFSEWLVDDGENFGLLIDIPMEPGTGRLVFASREHEVEAERPHVVLNYAW